MKKRTRWLQLIGIAAGTVVAVSAVAAAVWEGSWSPIIAVGWLPAVLVAVIPGGYRRHRCLPRRSHGLAADDPPIGR
jgi:hypothetical protein